MSTSPSDRVTTAWPPSASTSRPQSSTCDTPDVGTATLYPFAVPGIRMRVPVETRRSPIVTGSGPDEGSSSMAASVLGMSDALILRRTARRRTGPEAPARTARLVPAGQCCGTVPREDGSCDWPSEQEPEQSERTVPVLGGRVAHPRVHDLE